MITPILSYYYGRPVEHANIQGEGDERCLEIVLSGDVTIRGEYEGDVAPDLVGSTFKNYVSGEAVSTLFFSGQDGIIFVADSYTIYDKRFPSDAPGMPENPGDDVPDFSVPDPSVDRVLTEPPEVEE